MRPVNSTTKLPYLFSRETQVRRRAKARLTNPKYIMQNGSCKSKNFDFSKKIFIHFIYFFKKVDQWKAKKRGDHKEVMKRARKAAELRQVIMYVKPKPSLKIGSVNQAFLF